MRTAVSSVIPSMGIVDILTTLVVALILCGCAALIFWIVFGPDFETSPRGARRSTRPSFYLEVIAFSFLAMLASSVLFLFSLRNAEHSGQPGPEPAVVARLPAAPVSAPASAAASVPGAPNPEPTETASSAAPAPARPAASREPPTEPAEAPPSSATAGAAPESKPAPVPETASPPSDVKLAPAPAVAGVASEGKPATAPAAEGEAAKVAMVPTPAVPSAASETKPATSLPPAAGIADIAPASGTAPEASPASTSSGAPAAAPESVPSAAAAPSATPAETSAAPSPARMETASAPPQTAAVATPRSTAIDILIQRGDELRDTGDFAAARLFYERAAEEGSAAAARAVGETYDPIVLADAHARGVRSDPKAAAKWYRKAIAGGDTLAEQMLQRLTAKFSG